MFFDKRSQKNTPAPAVAEPVAPVGQVSEVASISSSKGGRAVIGATVKIKGEVHSEEDLTVEGQIEGTIVLKSNELVVGSSGRVHADVTAKAVKVEGELHGDVEASERVLITVNGSMRGNIQAPRVILEDGSKFKGSIDMNEAAPVKSFGVVSSAKVAASGDSTGE
ncbi:MAG: polymer-forming cytoskeletal protein [Halieaceae bacterium]|nr:polymer-forming cytoskeletal protein [Halieaceae bacterium]